MVRKQKEQLHGLEYLYTSPRHILNDSLLSALEPTSKAVNNISFGSEECDLKVKLL